MKVQKKSSWLERVEDIVKVLEGSTVSDFTLTEGDTQITIRRAPNVVLTSAQAAPAAGKSAVSGIPTSKGQSKKNEKSISAAAPLTGVYYSATSPTTPAFVNIGDVIQVGQVIALIEAMKVFNEITSEVAGRVTKILPSSGDVVQKGEPILLVEPLEQH